MKKDRVIWDDSLQSWVKEHQGDRSWQRISGVYVTDKEMITENSWTSEILVESERVMSELASAEVNSWWNSHLDLDK